MTSLVSDTVGRSLLVVGCGDGSVRLFDRRLSPNDSRVMTLREHHSWVVNVVLEKECSESIISGRLYCIVLYCIVLYCIVLYCIQTICSPFLVSTERLNSGIRGLQNPFELWKH